MKVFENKKENLNRYVKIFGLTIMEQSSDYMTAERTQKFLGGIIKTFKTRNAISNCSEKEIKFLDKSIIKRNEENNYMIYRVFGKVFKKVSIINTFTKKYSKHFDKKHDDIYILNANSGEVYLTLTYILDSLIQKNNSKTPLLVATKKYHVDIIKMICPDLPYIYVKNMELRMSGKSFEANGFRFFLMFNSSYFKQVEIDIKEKGIGEHHYFKSIVNHFELDEKKLKMRKINILPEAEESMLKKIRKTGLNLDNFIFLSPEAQSCELYDEFFWVTIINELQKQGYDIFVNLVGDEVQLKNATAYKSCFLTYAEAFSLARYAKRIISLRSGLTEFLLQTNVPIDVLYTKFRYRHFFEDMNINHVMSGFGISKLPSIDTNKIREFNTSEMSLKNCIKSVAII